MPNVEKISIALTPEMAGMVCQAVEAGEYASSSEVIREALRGWKHRRAMELADIEELRRLWAEGIESGPGKHASMKDIITEVRRRASEPS